MTLFLKTTLLLVLVTGSCTAQSAPANKEADLLKKLLEKGLETSFGKQPNPVVTRLLQNARFQPGLAVASGEEGGKTIVACAKRVSPILGDHQKKSLIRPFLAAEVIRQRAGQSPQVQAALKPFKFGHLLYSQLGVRLLSKVQGTIFGLGENTHFLTGKNYVVGVVTLIPKQIEIKATELLKLEEIRPIYRVAVIRQFKATVAKGLHKEALPLLFEAKKFGYDSTKEYYIDLYRCFLFTGKPEQMAQIAEVMVQRHGLEMDDEACLALASLATKAKQAKEAQFWKVEAEKRSAITLDSFLKAAGQKSSNKSSENNPRKR